MGQLGGAPLDAPVKWQGRGAGLAAAQRVARGVAVVLLVLKVVGMAVFPSKPGGLAALPTVFVAAARRLAAPDLAISLPVPRPEGCCHRRLYVAANRLVPRTHSAGSSGWSHTFTLSTSCREHNAASCPALGPRGCEVGCCKRLSCNNTST